MKLDESNQPMSEQPGPNESTPFVMRAKTRWFAVMFALSLVIILAVVVLLPRCGSYPGQVPAATIQIACFGTALETFKADNGYFPRGSDGLMCLTQRPSDATNWHGPYLERPVPMDPWGHAYIYECPGRHNPQGYDLSSMGPDGRGGGDDDICNWK